MSKLWRIGILGHVGHQNLGDEAIIQAVIQNLRYRFEEVQIVAFTMRPEDTRERHGIEAYPLRQRRTQPTAQPAGSAEGGSAAPHRGDSVKGTLRSVRWLYSSLRGIRSAMVLAAGIVRETLFLASAYRNLGGVDLLLIAGSHQVNDFAEGIWGFPYTIFKWCLLARLRRTKLAFLSVGAGPVDAPMSRLLYRRALSWAFYRSFRDDHACRVVAELGVAGPNPFVPDLAFSLNVPESEPGEPKMRPVVAINPLPFFDASYWHASNPALYTAYTDTLARFACWLVETGHMVSLFPTQLRVDPGVIGDIRRCIGEIDGAVGSSILEPAVGTFTELWNVIARADIVVATRYHGILLALLAEKPVLALAYHGKSRDLMEFLGQSDYVVGAAECDLERLKQRFLALESGKHSAVEELGRRLPEVREAVSKQFDEVLKTFFELAVPNTHAAAQATVRKQL